MTKKIQPEIRKDYIQDKYVIIAPARNKRPQNLERPQQKKPAKTSNCIFCPNQVDKIMSQNEELSIDEAVTIVLEFAQKRI